MSPAQHDRPPVFTLDTVERGLERTIFQPAALAWLPVLAAAWAVKTGKAPLPALSLAPGELLEQSTHVLNLVQLTAFARKLRTAIPGWLKKLYVGLVLLRLHRIATRYVKNLGRFQADPIRFHRDVIVITGGSAGIGKAMVERLSKAYGAKIAVLDMGPPTYAPAARGNPDILYIKTDITRKDAVAAAAEQIRARFGRDPSVLINNAGIFMPGLILEKTQEQVLREFSVNALSHWVTVQQFLPAMLKENHGHIVTIASSASYMSLPHMSAYAASKSAALAFHESLTGELRARYAHADRIRTTVVCPTKVQTALGSALADHQTTFLGPNLYPEQVAGAVTSAIASGNSKQIILPVVMNLLPTISRGPAWLRRIFEVYADSDHYATDELTKKALAGGYKAREAEKE